MSVWSILMFMSAWKLLDEQPATVDLCSCPSAVHDVSHDSLVTALELRALETWSVRPAKVPDCNVTNCGSHVKRVVTRDAWLSDVRPRCVVAGFVERGLVARSTRVELVCVLSFQLSFMMSLTILSSPRQSCAVGHASDCGSHVKRAVTRDVWQSREHRAACYWVGLRCVVSPLNYHS